MSMSLNEDDWPDEGSGPQHPAEDPSYLRRESLFASVDIALSDFRRAAEDGELVHGASCGLSGLQSIVDSGKRMDCPATRAAFLQVLALIRAALRIALPEFDRDEIGNGIDAAIGQVVYVFESEERRRTTSLDDLELLRAHTRILRNDLHSLSLLAGVPHMRAILRSGRMTHAAFTGVMRRDFARMAANEAMNEELRAQIIGRPAPIRELRLVG